MQAKVPLQITFRNLNYSDAIASKIEQQLDRLYRYCDRIIDSKVVVEVPHHHHRKNNPFHIRIELNLPGKTLVVDRNLKKNCTYNNPYIAIRDAFDAAQVKIKRFTDTQKATNLSF